MPRKGVSDFMNKISQRTKGIVCILFAAFGFSMMTVFVRLAGDVPTAEKAFFRNFVALLLGDRLRLLLHDREACYMAGMYYLGMLMVSMTNPGLFCPLPNAALTVLVFTVLEKCVDGPAAALHRRK